jgi:hypothetical protein
MPSKCFAVVNIRLKASVTRVQWSFITLILAIISVAAGRTGWLPPVMSERIRLRWQWRLELWQHRSEFDQYTTRRRIYPFWHCANWGRPDE